MHELSADLRKRLRLCPYCSQPLPATRLGIALPPLKIVIFDLIHLAGTGGILADDLYGRICINHTMTRKTLKAHFFQINKRIASTGYRIISRGRVVRLVSVWNRC